MRHYFILSYSVISTQREIWKKETVFVTAIKADKVMEVKCAGETNL